MIEVQEKEHSKMKNEAKAGYTHFYVYDCVESTETRGSSKTKGKNHTVPKKACGYPNLRFTKKPIDDQHRPQGKPCDNCGRRQRLNGGIVSENPINEWVYHTHTRGEQWAGQGKAWLRDGVAHASRSRTGPADVKARQQWALDEYERRKQAWLSRCSNAIEHDAETIEHGGELIE